MSHSPLLRSLGGAGRAVWNNIPDSVLNTRACLALGHYIHKTVCVTAKREQSGGTWFFRNVPLLTALAEQVRRMRLPDPLRLCCLGCCTGAEVYSVLWTVRTRIPRIRIATVALDISCQAVDRAKEARYKLGAPELRSPIAPQVLSSLFYQEGECLTVRPWLREGIQWIVGDARDLGLSSLIGPQDIVLANNFLVHMNASDATQCMVGLTRLIRPGGLLVCRGVDLDVRSKVVCSLGMRPVTALIEEIHDADPDLDARNTWPWHYTSLEPLDKRRRNWQERYAAIFQLPPTAQPSISDQSLARAAGA